MAETFSVAYTATPAPANCKVLVEATRSVSPGRFFVNPSWFRQVHVSAAAAASPANILTGYKAIFGAPIVGKKVFVRLTIIGSGGLRSAPIVGSVLIA